MGESCLRKLKGRRHQGGGWGGEYNDIKLGDWGSLGGKLHSLSGVMGWGAKKEVVKKTMRGCSGRKCTKSE